jgi:hypothetical protein
MVGIACVPLMLASMWMACAAAILIGLVALPAIRWFEHRDTAWRENVYRFGAETVGRVIDVEPAGSTRRDHIIRVEFRTDRDVVQTSVVGCPLARQGLAPDDDVLIYYAPAQPTHCLIVRKAVRPGLSLIRGGVE